jgi:hypothetical protein
MKLLGRSPFNLAVGSAGLFMVGIYGLIEYLEYGELKGVYTHVMSTDPLLHLLVLMLIPIFAVLGRLMEGRTRDVELYSENLEKAVKERTAQLQAIFDTTPNMIFIYSKDGRVIEVNENVVRKYGYTKEELINTDPSKLMGEGCDREMAMEMIRLSLKGEPHDVEWVARKKSGEEFPVDMRLRKMELIVDGGKREPGVLAIGRDITERKEAEEEIKKRTKELEDSNRLKDLFTDIMSHDFLNPIGTVKISSQILLDDETDPERERITEIIENTASKMEEMIKNASLFSKLETIDRSGFHVQDLGTILKASAKEFESQLKEKKMELAYLPDGEFSASANPIIGNVFSNLISNAIKYSPEGSRIEIDIQDQDDRWVISVKDSGDGVPDKYKESIFARFDRGSRKGIRGTGVGLAIAKRILELHQGKIWVEDNPDGGSIFYVELPKGKGS